MDANAYKDLGRSKLDAFKAKRAVLKAAGSIESQANIKDESAYIEQNASTTSHANSQVFELRQMNEQLNAQITELHDKCAAAEKGKNDADERAAKSARDAREAAEQLLLVETRVGSLQVEIDQVRLSGQASGDQIRSEVSKWKEQALSLEASLQEKDKLLADLSIESKALEERYQRLHDRHETAHNEFNRLKQISSERKARISELENQLDASAATSSKRDAMIARLQQELSEANDNLQIMCDKLSSITDQRDALKDAVGELQGESQSYISQVSSLQSLIDELRQSAAAERDRSLESHELRAQLENSLEELSEVKCALASEVERGVARTSESEQKVAELQSKLVRAKAQFDKVKASSAEHKDQATKLKEEVDALTEQNGHYEHQLADLSSRSNGSLKELSHFRTLFEQATAEVQSYQSQISESQDVISSLEIELSASKSQISDMVLKLDEALVNCAREWEVKLDRERIRIDEEWGLRVQSMIHEAEVSWASRLSAAVEERKTLESQLKEAEARAEDADVKSKAARDKLAMGKSKFVKLQSTLQERTDELASLQQHFNDCKSSADAKVLSLEALIAEQAVNEQDNSPTVDSSTDPLPLLSNDAATDPSVPAQADSWTDAVALPTVATASTLTVEDMVPQALLDEAEDRHSKELLSHAQASELQLDALTRELSELREAYSTVSQCLEGFHHQAQCLLEQDEAKTLLLDEARADLERAQIQSEDLSHQLEDLEEARAAAASSATLEASKAHTMQLELSHLRDATSETKDLQRTLEEAQAAKTECLKKIDELRRSLQESEAAKTECLEKMVELQRSLQESEAAQTECLETMEELQRTLEEAQAAKTECLEKMEELQRSLQESEAAKSECLEKMEELQRSLEEAQAAKTECLKKKEELQRSLQESEAAKTESLETMVELQRSLQESEAAKTECLEELQRSLQESEAAKTESLETMVELQRSLQESEAAKSECLEKMEELQRSLEEAQAAKTEFLKKKEELQRSLQESEAAKTESLETMVELRRSLQESEAAKTECLEELQRSLQESEAAKTESLETMVELQRSLQESEAAKTECLEELQRSLQEKSDALAVAASRCQELSSLLVESEARVEELQEKLGFQGHVESDRSSVVNHLEIEKTQILSQLLACRQELEDTKRKNNASLASPWASPARGMGKKSDLPGTIDPELAILEGGSATFQPLSGRLIALIPRGRIDSRFEEWLVKLLSVYGSVADRATVVAYKRPSTRGLALLYFIILHILILLSLIY